MLIEKLETKEYKICKECGASDSQIEVDYNEFKKIKEKCGLIGLDKKTAKEIDINTPTSRNDNFQ